MDLGKEGGVKPPHSKALRAFSCTVVSRGIVASGQRRSVSGREREKPGGSAQAVPGIGAVVGDEDLAQRFIVGNQRIPEHAGRVQPSGVGLAAVNALELRS